LLLVVVHKRHTTYLAARFMTEKALPIGNNK
jgi:hypothetical protein